MSDLPTGWKATPHDASDDNSDDKQLDTRLARCIGVSIPPGADDNDAGTVHSPDFKNGDNEIDSEAGPARDVAAHKRFNTKVLASPKADGCLTKFLRVEIAKSTPAGGKIGKIKAHVAGRSSQQPSNVQINFAAQLELTANGQTINLFIDLVDMIGTKVGAELDFEGIGAAIPTSTQRAAVSAVAARVADA
ncbi:hypothetical protein [uncultured Jatrophihabitans sp.]|uniref:hypothetical protein n=1 Tax=uncultured Jatrophihabitans sp. TaxID=1610747 RepID=UPI0035CA8DBA